MKKISKIAIITLSIIGLSIISVFLLYFFTTFNVKFDEKKFIDDKANITYLYSNGEEIENTISYKKNIDYYEINDNTKNAFIAIEDKRFYSHNGIDTKGMLRALFNNIKSFSFKEGASTITQQLVKNVFLSSDKTIKRKFVEIKLAKELEKKYTKNEIINKYLNTIYFGDNCYGIYEASTHYFNKEPNDLSLNESAILAGLIKAPSTYSPTKNANKCFKRKNIVLSEMFKQGKITKTQYEESIKEEVKTTNDKNISNKKDYIYLVKREAEQFAEKTGNIYNKLKVYTFFDSEIQKSLENSIQNDDTLCNKSLIVLDKNNHIKAYLSTCGEINRPLGSCIKPIGVYAPAIDKKIVNELTPILDEKTNFNGYTPSNYGEKYDGYISLKDSLKKSKNVCAVKILENLGIKESKKYLSKLNIEVNDNDNSLCLALGQTNTGTTLSKLCASYQPFITNGFYNQPTCLSRIEDENGRVLYNNLDIKTKIFNDTTSFIMNDILHETVTNGTAKRLSYSNVETCAKTGTVGNKNGNTDAYTISYNNDYIVGVWYGNKDNKLLDNSITGGTNPCDISKNIWNNIYLSNCIKFNNYCENIVELNIDKNEYQTNNMIYVADENTPINQTIKGYFDKNDIKLFKKIKTKMPIIENVKTSVNYNQISISLCLSQNTNAVIYKMYNNKFIEVYDTKNNDLTFIDKNITEKNVYNYKIVPYSNINNKFLYGNEVVLPKIKVPSFDGTL